MRWPWKLGQSHQSHINFSFCNNDTIHKVWLESIVQFKRYHTKTLFGSKFIWHFKVLVWPWKSPTSNQLLTLSLQYIFASLVKIEPPVRKIVCRNGWFIVFIGWWHWKLYKGHQKSNQLFPPFQQCIYAGLVEIHPLVQNIAHRNPILNISKCPCDLEN